MSGHHGFFDNIEKSALLTVIGVIILFSASVLVVMVAPNLVEKTWIEPTSPYQVQMYEEADPNFYIGKSQAGSSDLSFVYHIKEDSTLLAFQESSTVRIVSPPELEKYITRYQDPHLKLTSRLLLLRTPQNQENEGFNAAELAKKSTANLQSEWEKSHPQWKEQGLVRPDFISLELFAPGGKDAFAVGNTDGILENWVDDNYSILDKPREEGRQNGVIYVLNPAEYRVSEYTFAGEKFWKYDPNGQKINSLQALLSHPLGFISRKELIQMGENIYKIEGCWYCHTDQTRTLIQDVVLNGSDSYPAPPSSANEYIYQSVTFPGTRRIGPDLSRTGIKRPSRDWHKGHFWSPKTASKGSIMPSFRHFFDADPRGTARTPYGIPNYRFEAIYQYLMTKGTRITPPNQAWWLGKDPLQTKAIIEGKKVIK